MSTPVKPLVTLSEWDHHAYQQLEPTADGNYVVSDSCLICAGPPLLSQTGGIAANANLTGDVDQLALSDTTAYPLGLIQGFSIGQNRQQMRIFEIGSNYDYIMSGRSVGNLTISKVYYSAASLLRVLYAYYGTTGQHVIEPLFQSPIAAAGAMNDVFIGPGSERIFINMFSDLFRNPIGILVVMMTTQNSPLGVFYLERCMIHGHNIAFDSQGVIIQENVTMSFSRINSVHIDATNILAALRNFGDFFDLTGNL